jgi:AcrR family transcriptional regulator
MDARHRAAAVKRRAKVELAAVVTAIFEKPDLDEVDTKILDAAELWLRTVGLRRWSIDDVATRADVGRTSVYRRFGDRDNLVHAVLARELRTTLFRMRDAMAAEHDLEDKAVAAVSAALRSLDDSVSDSLLRSDPETFLPFLTTEAGPLLDLARAAITHHMATYVDRPSPELAEAAARFGLSFVLTRATILPLHDDEQLADAVRTMIHPFLVALQRGN